MNEEEKNRIINQLIGLMDCNDTSGRAEWCQGWLRNSLIRQGFWVPNQPAKPILTNPTFTGVICKGCKSLNSHCGKCDKCKFYGWSKNSITPFNKFIAENSDYP